MGVRAAVRDPQAAQCGACLVTGSVWQRVRIKRVDWLIAVTVLGGLDYTYYLRAFDR